MGFFCADNNPMAKGKNIKQVLADNINRLMGGNPDYDTTLKLAKRSGVGNGTVGRIRNAQVAATVDTIEAIAAVFRIKPHELLAEPDQPEVALQAAMTAGKTGQLLDLWRQLPAELQDDALNLLRTAVSDVEKVKSRFGKVIPLRSKTVLVKIPK